MDSNNDPGPSGDVIDLTSLSSPELPSQKTEVACPAQQIISLEHSQRDTTNIATSSDKTLLFSPPAVTLDIFKEYSDEDDDKTCKKEPEGTSTIYTVSLCSTKILKSHYCLADRNQTAVLSCLDSLHLELNVQSPYAQA